MRIESEQSGWAAISAQTSNDSVRKQAQNPASRQSGAAEPTTASAPQAAQKRASAKSDTPPPPQFPQDEVKVEWDKQFKDDVMIYQLLDKQSGALVLQVPSQEVLSVAHAINESLQPKPKEEAQTSSSAISESGKK
jgi:uncharacterized FlaG/YvyC family protein